MGVTLTTAENVYCYHCRTSHPKTDMRQIVTKTGKRWRCQQSLDAIKSSKKERESFGKKVTEANKQDARKTHRLTLGIKT
jgi:hypothetical protein